MKTSFSLSVLFSSLAVTFAPRSSTLILSAPRKVSPDLVTATWIESSLLASSWMVAAVAIGSVTLTLLFSIGVITMKMISSTSITSTIGVTLMLELTFLPSSRLLIPIRFVFLSGFQPPNPANSFGRPVRLRGRSLAAPKTLCPGRFPVLTAPPRRAVKLLMALLDEVVRQFAGAVVHLHVKGRDLVREVVEGHNRRDRNQQTERRRYQRLGDTACHRADTRSLLGRDLLEGVQDADHGAEQADERRRRTDRRQTAKAALQLRVHDRLGAFQSALRALHLLHGDLAARTEAAELLQTGRHNLGQVRLLAAVAQLDRLIQTAILQRARNLGRELARLLARRREVQRAVDDHSQRPDRHDEQNKHHALGHPAHVVPQAGRTEADRSAAVL